MSDYLILVTLVAIPIMLIVAVLVLPGHNLSAKFRTKVGMVLTLVAIAAAIMLVTGLLFE